MSPALSRGWAQDRFGSFLPEESPGFISLNDQECDFWAIESCVLRNCFAELLNTFALPLAIHESSTPSWCYPVHFINSNIQVRMSTVAFIRSALMANNAKHLLVCLFALIWPPLVKQLMIHIIRYVIANTFPGLSSSFHLLYWVFHRAKVFNFAKVKFSNFLKSCCHVKNPSPIPKC